MVGIILLEDLEDEIVKDGAVSHVREAVEVAAGGDTPGDELERDHLYVPCPEGGAVDVFHEVGAYAVSLEQFEDVASRSRGRGRLAFEHVVLGTVTSGDVIHADNVDLERVLSRLDALGLALVDRAPELGVEPDGLDLGDDCSQLLWVWFEWVVCGGRGDDFIDNGVEAVGTHTAVDHINSGGQALDADFRVQTVRVFLGRQGDTEDRRERLAQQERPNRTRQCRRPTRTADVGVGVVTGPGDVITQFFRVPVRRDG